MNTTLTELGVEVPVDQIEKGLRQLLAADTSRTNASLMNLVVYSEKKGSLLENSTLISELTQEHACRALIIEMDRETSDVSVRSWITAHCHLNHGKKTVCCEQIAFALTGVSRGRLRNTVFAHLGGDLPLVMWWQGELSSVCEERLYSHVDRFIFDSSSWSNPADGLARMSMAAEEGNIIMQDLAWTRTYAFRLAVASLFDDPLAQKNLDAIESIHIAHHKDHRNSALILVAWLATQAKWRRGLELNLSVMKRSEGTEIFHFEHQSGRQIEITLTDRESEYPISSLLIQSEDMNLSIERNAASQLHLSLQVKGHNADSLAPADPLEDISLVASQLSRGGKNSLFLKVLPLFRDLLH